MSDINSEAFKQSNHDLQRLLFSSHYKKAYRFAYMIVKNHSIAEDVVQESYIKAFKNLSQLRNMDSFLPWFTRIIYNCAITILKNEKKLVPIENLENKVHLFTGDSNMAEDNAGIDMEAKEEVRTAIAHLDIKYREIIYMRFYWDFSYEQIAAATDISVGTVKSRLNRGKEMIRYLLQNNVDAAVFAEEVE